MKKTLSVILAALMLLCCLPFAAYAATEPAAIDTGYLAENNYVLSAGTYFVPVGNTLTIPQGRTLYLDTGAALDVYGTIDVQGKLISRGGLFTLKISDDGTCGLLKKPENVGGNSSDSYLAEVLFDAMPSDYLMPEHRVIDASVFVSSNGSSYADLAPDSYFTPVNFGSKYTVKLNQYLFFKMKLVDGDNVEKYDSSRLKFAFNGVAMKNEQNRNQVFVTSAGIVKFEGKATFDEDYYLKRFSVYIPTGTGYTVFGKDGETSGPTETVQLCYGEEFMFRLDLDKNYNKSIYEVYCINNYKWNDEKLIKSLPEFAAATDGIDADLLAERWADSDFTVVKFSPDDPAKCYIDENGYYHIPAEYMVRDCSINVTGVVKNETISLAAKLIDMLRSFIESIKTFFEDIMAGIR